MENSSANQENGQKYLTIMSMVVANAWKDPAYKANLISQPEAVLQEEGLAVTPGVKFTVLENTDTVRYVPLSRSLDKEKDVDQLTAILASLLPISQGTEIRFVQSTEGTRYVVIPMPPANTNVQVAHEELRNLAANVTTNVTVQSSAAVTTVAAVGEVVAVTVVVVT